MSFFSLVLPLLRIFLITYHPGDAHHNDRKSLQWGTEKTDRGAKCFPLYSKLKNVVRVGLKYLVVSNNKMEIIFNPFWHSEKQLAKVSKLRHPNILYTDQPYLYN